MANFADIAALLAEEDSADAEDDIVARLLREDDPIVEQLEDEVWHRLACQLAVSEEGMVVEREDGGRRKEGDRLVYRTEVEAALASAYQMCRQHRKYRLLG